MIFKVLLEPSPLVYLMLHQQHSYREGWSWALFSDDREGTTPLRESGWCLQGVSKCLGDFISKVCALFFNVFY